MYDGVAANIYLSTTQRGMSCLKTAVLVSFTFTSSRNLHVSISNGWKLKLQFAMKACMKSGSKTSLVLKVRTGETK